jgi:hypothetical protein
LSAICHQTSVWVTSMSSGYDDALARLKQTLTTASAPENEYRADLAEALREIRRLLKEVEVAAVSPRSSLAQAADDVERALGSFRGDADQLNSLINNLRQEVAVALTLDVDPDHRLSLNQASEAAAEAARLEAEMRARSDQMARLLDGARRLVGDAADDKLAKHYRSEADKERDLANTWRKWTIAGFSLTLLFALATAALAIIGERELESILGTGGLGIATGGFTGYLGSQAGLHRARETSFRQAELRLAVIGPMLDAVSPDGRDSVRSEVVKRLFGDESPQVRSRS